MSPPLSQAPIKEGSQLSISTGHSQGSEASEFCSLSLESLSSAKIMKLCVTALSLLMLVAAFCSPALSAPMGSDPPTACCFSYTLRKLPRNFVTDYYETSSLCSQPAVVFQTKKGRQICANPSEPWVQEYMDDLELN
ncbi:C-C motif chemokine 4-like [Dasypus novemcinctus]|uniref:C-C motif chemokine 4-like n=1 Tax=Dasypus novemcinctus TaxID=9361 RepID=UPI00265F7BE7|nr:C-C motif chemokine 4-like [Dasypus novemcinctus]